MRLRRRIRVFNRRGFEKRNSIIFVPNIGEDVPVIISKPHKKRRKISKLAIRFAGWKRVLLNGFPRP